jgi:hypothetical protein
MSLEQLYNIKASNKFYPYQCNTEQAKTKDYHLQELKLYVLSLVRTFSVLYLWQDTRITHRPYAHS